MESPSTSKQSSIVSLALSPNDPIANKQSVKRCLPVPVYSGTSLHKIISSMLVLMKLNKRPSQNATYIKKYKTDRQVNREELKTNWQRTSSSSSLQSVSSEALVYNDVSKLIERCWRPADIKIS